MFAACLKNWDAKGKTTVMEQNCGNCRHFHRVQDGQPLGYCHALPPTVLLTGMIPSPIAGQAPRPVTSSFWPPVDENQVCGAYSHGPMRVIATAEQVSAVLADLDAEGSA